MLRIVTDGAVDMPEGWENTYDIQVVPINIQFKQRSFLQGIDLSNADFYRMAEEGGTIPQTSQPSPQQFADFYRKVAQRGETILSMHVTAKLSGTFASAEWAARELAGQYNILPFDSASGSAALGYMCREARLLERAGKTLEQIVERMEFIRRNVVIVLTLNTLEYARRSGRVKALQAALASLLNIKPVIVLKDGALEMGERVRTRRRALDFVVEDVRQRLGGRPANVAVVQAEDPGSGQFLLEKVRAEINCQDLIMTDLSIAVAANLGPGTVGIAAYPVE
ncbi:MAG TPA: DegV family protein [Anaerolineales bacterium]